MPQNLRVFIFEYFSYVRKYCLKNCRNRESERNPNSNMRRAGLSGWVGHPPSEAFCATEKTWTFDSSPLLLAPRRQAQKQKQKSFYSDGQYVQLICVGHPPIMGAICRVHKKTFRDSCSSSCWNISSYKRECCLHSKSFFFQIPFLDDADSVTWGGILQGTQEHQQPPKKNAVRTAKDSFPGIFP